MHVFVCSNSWLDVRYGAKLQEYLLSNAHIRAIYESAIEKQFFDINTIISILRKFGGDEPVKPGSCNCMEPFESAVAEGGLVRREILMTRKRPAEPPAMSGGKFVGDKWGREVPSSVRISITGLSQMRRQNG